VEKEVTALSGAIGGMWGTGEENFIAKKREGSSFTEGSENTCCPATRHAKRGRFLEAGERQQKAEYKIEKKKSHRGNGGFNQSFLATKKIAHHHLARVQGNARYIERGKLTTQQNFVRGSERMTGRRKNN